MAMQEFSDRLAQPNPSQDMSQYPVTRLQVFRSFLAVPNRLELLMVASASVLVLVPCIWLSRIESFDLCSHIYNAWLARLITEQHLPGLWIARQSTNILFDNLLTLLMKPFGPLLAQRILVGVSVLLLFWSSFSLVSVLSDRRPWFLLPCLAMLSYGRVFHYGFFNFYVSLAFAFLALSFLWKESSWRYILFVLMLALSWSAHPLPALWAICAAGYVHVVRHAPRRIQLTFLCGAALGVLVIGTYQRVTFPLSVGPQAGLPRRLLAMTGWDQVLAFASPFSVLSYRSVELGILFVFLFLLIRYCIRVTRIEIFSSAFRCSCTRWLVLRA